MKVLQQSLHDLIDPFEERIVKLGAIEFVANRCLPALKKDDKRCLQTLVDAVERHSLDDHDNAVFIPLEVETNTVSIDRAILIKAMTTQLGDDFLRKHLGKDVLVSAHRPIDTRPHLTLIMFSKLSCNSSGMYYSRRTATFQIQTMQPDDYNISVFTSPFKMKEKYFPPGSTFN